MALQTLQRSVTVRHNFFGFIPKPLASTCIPRRLFCTHAENAESENKYLLKSLNLMGVDVRMARHRQPGVLCKSSTNEQGLAHFLQGKGSSCEVVANIISRYPRAITRSIDHLEQRWQLWCNIFETDAEIVSIMDRSPDSFFRSSDNDNLQKNIVYLVSLGLNNKDLHLLLNTAPRTLSNSVELNKQMVEFLKDTCIELGGSNPEQFAKTVISRNLYILIRSCKRVKTNIGILREALKLKDSELLAFLQGPGAKILDISNEYLIKNFYNLEEKMTSFGCWKADVKKMIITYPMILFIGHDTLSSKIDCLIKGGIKIKQILEKPRVFSYSTQNIAGRLKELRRVGFDFQKNGISVLDTSRKRFHAKMEKLSASPDQ